MMIQCRYDPCNNAQQYSSEQMSVEDVSRTTSVTTSSRLTISKMVDMAHHGSCTAAVTVLVAINTKDKDRSTGSIPFQLLGLDCNCFLNFQWQRCEEELTRRSLSLSLRFNVGWITVKC